MRRMLMSSNFPKSECIYSSQTTIHLFLSSSTTKGQEENLKSQVGPDGKNAIGMSTKHMVLKELKQDVTNQQDKIMSDAALGPVMV